MAYKIHFRDNAEIIETFTAATLDEAVSKALRMAELPAACAAALRAGEQVTHDDCETVEIAKA